jgi:hypothetical protein
MRTKFNLKRLLALENSIGFIQEADHTITEFDTDVPQSLINAMINHSQARKILQEELKKVGVEIY